MDKIEVTQADRDAAAAVLHDNLGWYRAAPVRAGEMDNDSVVQAFARHRATRTDATPVAAYEGLSEAMYTLSAQLAMTSWLDDDTNHAIYERVVKAWQVLDKATPPATDVAALVEADDVDAWFQVGALKEQLRQANETIKALNGHLPAYAAAMKENKELKSAEADLVKVIRSQPYPESDDYIEVRRDERERIISALAPFTKAKP